MQNLLQIGDMNSNFKFFKQWKDLQSQEGCEVCKLKKYRKGVLTWQKMSFFVFLFFFYNLPASFLQRAELAQI